MKRALRIAPCALALLLLLAQPLAADRPPLSEVREIDGTLLAVAIANEVRQRCDDIAPRMIRAWSTLNGLKAKARDLGYSEDEIEDYVTSEAEKARMRRLGEIYVRQQGADPAVTADLCAFGRAEIARSTAVGRLLREK
jgi:hypothetical protein